MASTGQAWQASIERDALGVPHIFGETDADMAFGLAWAQAEDGWEILEETLPYYRGEAARYFGREAAVTDYLIKWLGFWDVSFEFGFWDLGFGFAFWNTDLGLRF